MLRLGKAREEWSWCWRSANLLWLASLEAMGKEGKEWNGRKTRSAGFFLAAAHVLGRLPGDLERERGVEEESAAKLAGNAPSSLLWFGFVCWLDAVGLGVQGRRGRAGVGGKPRHVCVVLRESQPGLADDLVCSLAL